MTRIPGRLGHVHLRPRCTEDPGSASLSRTRPLAVSGRGALLYYYYFMASLLPPLRSPWDPGQYSGIIAQGSGGLMHTILGMGVEAVERAVYMHIRKGTSVQEYQTSWML